MKPSLIIDVLRMRGVALAVKDGLLSVKSREGQLHECEIALIQRHKAKIIAILQAAPDGGDS